MISHLRQRYNDRFEQARYEEMMDWITEQCGERPNFHVAETPIFVDDQLRERLKAASDDIAAVVTAPDFSRKAEAALLPGQQVPGRTKHPLFLQMDFGLCLDENGDVTPQLIEAQGFPSLYFFQGILTEAYRRYFDIPENYASFFNGIYPEDYWQMLSNCVLDGEAPENVVLLEVEPAKQVTRVDFAVAAQRLGIGVCCISDLELDGKSLFYQREGKRTQVKRIFNRVIFDELLQRRDLRRFYNLTEEVDVSWAGHPDWFFMLSKHTLPFFDSPYVPKSFFLNQPELPSDLENYVLKPLYSFAGSGVILNPSPEQIAAVPDAQRGNFILQRKVQYADLIATPDGPARAEVRLMYLWPEDRDEMLLVNNLVRLSKGEMIGVRYNKGKTWVGGSIGYFPRPD